MIWVFDSCVEDPDHSAGRYRHVGAGEPATAIGVVFAEISIGARQKSPS